MNQVLRAGNHSGRAEKLNVAQAVLIRTNALQHSLIVAEPRLKIIAVFPKRRLTTLRLRSGQAPARRTQRRNNMNKPPISTDQSGHGCSEKGPPASAALPATNRPIALRAIFRRLS